ncbi:DUF4428 domain-containing protein [Lactococcus lactis]|uniref:DUF4428 domain-containing protein n=1 Tax=Lactococcus lactis TaxID=1358 RepID=UPI0021A52B49|nr:DUF4428 domain-containing protein [Lactococcus lactis]MCT0052097.1 DUF4428 domain-containing protein [Lactococcus lactis subsp. lactis]
MAKQLCPVCNESKIGILSSEKILDGKICEKCLNKLGLKLAAISNENIIKFENLNIQKASSMIANGDKFDYKQEKEKLKSKKIQGKQDYKDLISSFKENESLSWENGVMVDSKEERFLFKKSILREEKVEPFSNLVSIEPVFRSNGKTKHHGVARGVIGGATFGLAGAVIGSSSGHKNYTVVSKMSLILRFSDDFTFEIKLISTETKIGLLTNQAEKRMNNYITFLNNIIEQNTSVAPPVVNQGASIADELKKFKELLDLGVITHEEFEVQKSKLLQ